MMNNRMALIIGNDDYLNVDKLRGCQNDCDAIEVLLHKNENGKVNFTPDKHIDIPNNEMKKLIQEHLNRSCIHLILYFSGHGHIDNEGGYICGTDASESDFGVSMKWLSEQINKSGIDEVTVILDCCHAGQMFNVESDQGEFAILRHGVSVLAAAKKDGKSIEFLGRGIFSTIMEEGLKGAAKDIFGHVSIARLYGCADKMLSPLQQRPVYKSFIDKVTPIRYCKRTLEDSLLQELNSDQFFPKVDHEIRINRDVLEKKQTDFDIDFDTFIKLQSFENAGLIECSTGKSLLETAFGRGTCQLNAYGRYIWKLVEKGEIKLT